MSWGRFCRDRLPQLLGTALGTGFAAALAAVLGAPAGAVAFLCLVLLVCGLGPLAAEYLRRRAFYRQVDEVLEHLGEKYLLPELLERPGFLEGALFCDALAVTAKAMNDAVAEARRDMGEYREFIEAWVHEVKLPIASARLALENRPGPLSARLEEDLFQIDRYVEQALYYARSGAVDRDYLVRAMPVRDAAADTVKQYARPLIEAGFRIDLSGLDAVVYSDKKWVQFILGQLVSNAMKYRGDRPPTLAFVQRLEEQSVVLTVEDNGVGISAADLPRVWDKGFTGANGRRLSTRSTGLGLYLCKKLCTQLGLGLEIASREGEGTQVSIIFPRGRFHLAGEC